MGPLQRACGRIELRREGIAIAVQAFAADTAQRLARDIELAVIDLDVGGAVILVRADEGCVVDTGRRAIGELDHKCVAHAAGMSRDRRGRRKSIPRSAGQVDAGCIDRDTADRAAVQTAQILFPDRSRRIVGCIELAQDGIAALIAGDQKIAVLGDGDGGDRLIACIADTPRPQRLAIGPDRADITVADPALVSLFAERAGRLAGDIDRAIAADGDRGSLVVACAAETLHPLFDAGSVVLDHDTVGAADPGCVTQRARDLTGDHDIAVVIDSDRGAFGCVGRPEHTAPDAIAGRIILGQDKILFALDNLAVGCGCRLADDKDATVHSRGRGLDLQRIVFKLGPGLAVLGSGDGDFGLVGIGTEPGRIADAGIAAGQIGQLDHLPARSVVDARCAGEIERRLGTGRREAETFRGDALDEESVFIAGDHTDIILFADLGAFKARDDAGGVQLGIDVGRDIVEISRLCAHIVQIDLDIGRGAVLGDRNGELNVTRETRNGCVEVTLVYRSGRELRQTARHGDFAFELGQLLALQQGQPFQVHAVKIVVKLRQPLLERLVQQRAADIGRALVLRLFGQRDQALHALMQREQRLVIVGGIDVGKLTVGILEEVARRQDAAAHLLERLQLVGTQIPGRRHIVALAGTGAGTRLGLRQGRRGRSRDARAVPARQQTLIDSDHRHGEHPSIPGSECRRRTQTKCFQIR